MRKTLIISEKPSVARDIAKVIINGHSSSKDGYIEGEKHIITWAIGHLVTLWEPEEYDEKYKKWSMETLPIIPGEFMLKSVSKTKKQFGIVKKLMNSKEVEDIVCATDSGREGELIFRYIYQLANCKKTFKRLWISSMTEEAIKKGFEELKDGSEYDNLYQSARCRSEADWLIGMNGTRAYTIKSNEIFSIGRVQTPTLAMIVNREMQIKGFDSLDYWEVKSTYEDFQGTWIDTKENSSKISSEKEAEAIGKKVEGTTGEVIDVKKEKKTLATPLLYDLTELQRDGNKYFGYTAKETLDIAQSLYEKHKLITYPRTDSRYLSEDMKDIVKETLNKLSISPYDKYISKIINNIKFTSRIINNKKITDHHACIPTPKTPNVQKLGIKEKNIYNLVVKRLIAAFFPIHQYETTTILVESQRETFLSKGNVVLDIGWKLLYANSDKKKKDKEEEQQLPPINKGDQVLFKEIEILKKQTQPPKQYTESTLLSAMENAGRLVDDEELKEQLKDNGIGTPATRAAIIERLIQVGYIQREKKSLVPTSKGISIINTVPEELKSAELTGKWEKALNNIVKGQFSPDRFMESINNFTTFIVTEANNSSPIEVPGNPSKASKGKRKSNKERIVIGTCPICKKGSITENSKGYGCSEYTDGCKFFIGGVIAGKKITTTEVKELIEKGETSELEGFTYKNGGNFNAKLTVEDGKIVFGKK